MRPKQLYVVLKGRKPGVFDSWKGENGAEIQVKGFSGSEFKGKFYDIDDAIKYYRSRCMGDPVVHFETAEAAKLREPDGNEYITYILLDPRSKSPFYVGQTKDLDRRKRAHLRTKEKPFKKVEKYISALRDEGMEPVFYIAEVCNNLEASLESELKWVRYCLQKGYELCNRWKEHRDIQE